MQYALIAWLSVLKYMYIVYNEIWKIDKCFRNLHKNWLMRSCQVINHGLELKNFQRKKNVSIKFIHDLEDRFPIKLDNLKILLKKISIYYGKKSWCLLLSCITYTRCLLDIQTWNFMLPVSFSLCICSKGRRGRCRVNKQIGSR